MSGSSGSGLFKKQAANVSHLAQGSHGMTGEIADVRRDVAKTVAPLVAVTIEEYLAPPPAQNTAIMTATATSTTAQTYSLAQLNGTIGGGAISPPRNGTVTTAGATATNAPASVTLNGLDPAGRVQSETIPGTNGGAATYSGTKMFSKFTSVTAPAAAGVDATIAVGTGAVIGLSQLPKLRAGLVLPLIRREIVDGAVVTSGALTSTTTNPPFGAYTPSAAPAANAPAVVTGTTDITAGALYGGGGTLDGLTVIATVNGVGPTTLTLVGTGNALSEAALLAAINTAFPGLTATQGGSGGNKLVLTDNTSGFQYTIVIGAGTANTALGLTPATTHGTGHTYCIEYEYDASQVTDA